MTNKHSIALLPLDNRPISYLLPKQIAEFSGINLILPERKYLGDLNSGTDLNYLEKWLNDLCRDGVAPSLMIAIDTWIYGGLVQSRKHSFSLDTLKNRVDKLKQLNNIKKYAFTSIMRTPSYDNSDEEKEDWKDYGNKIFTWSQLMHKVGAGIKEKEKSHEELIEMWYQSSKLIPPDILADYKSHRDKNFTVNMLCLDLLHENVFDYLIFSGDDSEKYGMNIVETEYLKKEIKKHNFSKTAEVVSGTDETALILLLKVMLKKTALAPKISLYFNSVSGENETARYESQSIYNSVLEKLKLLDLEITDFNGSDIVLCIHCADSIQGDHIFGEMPADRTKNVSELVNFLKKNDKPFILLDLAYANGSDPDLIETLITSKINWHMCYGYSGWNTCSNSTGSALSIGINRWLSEKQDLFNKKAFNECMFIRFLDDYAYQSKIRHKKITEDEINDKIKPYIQTFSKLFGLSDISVKCILPWKRSFEVEVELQTKN